MRAGSPFLKVRQVRPRAGQGRVSNCSEQGVIPAVAVVQGHSLLLVLAKIPREEIPGITQR